MNHQQERETFAGALEIQDPDQRRAFLTERCAGDEALRRRLERLLALHSAATDFFEGAEAVATTVLASEPGSSPEGRKPVGVPVDAEAEGLPARFRLISRLGEGGFGVVYLAEQTEPVRRRVAVKVLRSDIGSLEAVVRFEAERQVLARMDHPNIARILEAGTTSPAESEKSNLKSQMSSGRPFFVMEFVEGIPITDYCDERCLTVRQRVSLFLNVCEAVQHAHQKGIIHRDLKPTNILVGDHDGVARVKVIDFGVAKVVERSVDVLPVETKIGQMIGTPTYMSPEQADWGSLDVDTRSDVYALGVILYELLAGRTPIEAHRWRGISQAEMRQLLCEEEPPCPSARLQEPGLELAEVSRRRGVDSRRLRAQVRGELDWIVMRALEKDRSRRYETVSDLAQDLERYLRQEPVIAGPPGAAYRLGKFFQRHRAATLGVAAVLISLVTGLGVSLLAYFQVSEERDRARLSDTESQRQRALARREQRRSAEQALRAREIAYASDMNLAQNAWEESNLGRARGILLSHRPAADQEDLRGWEWRYLWQLFRSDALLTLGRHSNSVVSLSASEDGHWVVSGGWDDVCRVWEIGTKRCLATVSARQGMAWLHPDARRMFAVRTTGGLVEMMLRRAGATSAEREGAGLSRPDGGPPEPGMSSAVKGPGSGEVVRPEYLVVSESGRTWHPDRRFLRVGISSDGQRLAGVMENGRLVMRNETTGQEVIASDHYGNTRAHSGDLVFAWGKPWCAVGADDGDVQVLHAETGQLIRRWVAHDEPVMAVAWSPNDEILATGAGFTDRTIRLWRVSSGESAGVFQGHVAWVTALAFAPDGRFLASASADQTIRIWDVRSGDLLATLRGHLQEVWSLCFLADGETLISGGKDGVVKMWRPPLEPTRPGAMTLALASPVFDGSGSNLFGLDEDGLVVQAGVREPFHLESVPEFGGNCRQLASSPTGALLAAADYSGTVRVWNDRGLKLQAQLVSESVESDRMDMRFSGDGSLLVMVMGGKEVEVFETATWQRRGRWVVSGGDLGAFALSVDGVWLAHGRDELQVVRSLDGHCVARLRAHYQTLDAVAFSPDGLWLATGSQEGVARLWEVGSWKPVATLQGHLLGVHALAFSPEGTRLVTGSVGPEAVKVWDLRTFRELLTLSLDDDQVTGLQFSPDGSSLAASTAQGRVYAWWAPSFESVPHEE